jgi:hypothetical protein
MKINLDTAIGLLHNSQAVIVSGHHTMPVVYPCISDCEDDDEREEGWVFLELEWSCDRYNYLLKFESNNNFEIEFLAGRLYLKDTKDKEYMLTLLTTMPSEESDRIIKVVESFNPED